MSTETRTPRRRSTAEVRELILVAARELFAANGYEATRTQDIGERAGVRERLLFANFGSKAELFDAALTGPLSAVITEYIEAWDQHPEFTVEQRLTVFIEGLYDLARENRTVLRSVLGSSRDGEGPGADLFDHIARTLHRTLSLGVAAEYHDAAAALVDLAGMVFGVALLDDMLIPKGVRRPSRARLLTEMNKMAAHRLQVLSQPDGHSDGPGAGMPGGSPVTTPARPSRRRRSRPTT
jgi:AcrR family transcriptional regulator